MARMSLDDRIVSPLTLLDLRRASNNNGWDGDGDDKEDATDADDSNADGPQRPINIFSNQVKDLL